MSERDRLTDRRVMWRALYDAYQWSESVTDAYSNMPADDPVIAEEVRFRKALESVAMRYFGKGIKAAANEPFKGAKLVPIQELRAQRIAEKGAPHD